MDTNIYATDSEVVLQTKVVIVRNIKGYLFCPKMNMSDKESVIEKVRPVLSKLKFSLIRAEELDKKILENLYNNHFVSAEFVKNPFNKAVAINEEDGISIVINEKEHITIQVISDGSQIAKAYAKADLVASVIESNLEIAFSEKYGFLTSDTKKVGTGLRILSLVSIPGIEKAADALNILKERMNQYEWKISPLATVSGVKVPGMYILGNLATLGATEKDIVSTAAKVVEDIVKLEKKCRETICNRKKGVVEDKFFRSYGTLRYARRIDEQELFNLIYWLRIGLDAFGKEETDLTWEKINKITNRVIHNSRYLNSNQSVSLAATEECSKMVRSILKGED